MRRKRVVPTCHPDRIHGGYGLCKQCYAKKYKPADYNLKYKLRSVYGLTVEQYEAMIAAQNNLCAICGQPPSAKSKYHRKLALDHDHETGAVRGLLCHTCNRSLAWLENRQWFDKAMAYLHKYRRLVA